jgi:predicted unusual protein kinase regulating ubiquinone biosynthesis (AarF/ABC1/UbiB family)
MSSKDKPLARSSLRRGARLASLPLGFAGRKTLGLGRRLGGASADTVNEQLQERTAEQLFRVLGELKGGAMKVGQAMSLFESFLPDDVAAPYREKLSIRRRRCRPRGSMR